MPSPRLVFDRKTLSAIVAPQKRTTYLDEETRGLILDVTVNGVKTFRVYRKVAGRPERITLGRFNPSLPDSREFPRDTDLLKAMLAQPELNVRMARRLAEAVNLQLDSGRNPAETKRQARGELTLGQMLDRYIKDHAEPHKIRTLSMIRENFQRYLGALPDEPRKKHGKERTKPPFAVNWEHRRLSSIRTEEIRKLQLAAVKERTYATANRIVELLRRLYSKAILWGEFKGPSPVDGISLFSEVKRDRFVQAGEMPAFWKALDEETNEPFRDYVMLALLTGARAGNLMSMRWADIDLQASEWRIPDPDSKNGESMRVVLVPEAIDILERRRLDSISSWVFPADSASGHITPPKKPWAALLKRAGIANLRFHDLRRSLGSWQARTGASLIIIGKSLGHKSHEATQIYARLDTDPIRESVTRATSAMLAARRGEPAAVDPITKPKRRVA
ncbi:MULTISPECIES: site-specific integrase [unclassified Rhizobacter]|uniref:tyrosine-type recombinase/integrase n=1 Tax=unclassified Rhizobacter TaxID=2640088 RepID=UPI0007006DE3|nr:MULTISPECIES: tyrosine-type recombinase/integrase [unclassified Rhizobacter]KQU78178.1 hypothetical protein ASC88_20370 [Rhizobacter sp. Root29]KQW15924.1 hypothetical protein ASC98_01590 [Rhizobacter sp. Root1238]KRB25042.1 hypothetical protein ASE08_02340 [Rhizobacter sp. Root16D2]